MQHIPHPTGRQGLLALHISLHCAQGYRRHVVGGRHRCLDSCSAAGTSSTSTSTCESAPRRRSAAPPVLHVVCERPLCTLICSKAFSHHSVPLSTQHDALQVQQAGLEGVPLPLHMHGAAGARMRSSALLARHDARCDVAAASGLVPADAQTRRRACSLPWARRWPWACGR